MSLRHLYYFGIIDIQKKLYYQDTPYYRLMKLVGSENNILLSIKLLSENSGRNTPGFDQLRFQDLKVIKPDDIIKEVRTRIYHKPPDKARRVYIPKNNGKKRPLGIQSIYDRITQQCFLNILEPIVEKEFSNFSFGFRPHVDGIQSAQKYLQNNIANGKGRKYVLDVDLKNYFDTISVDKVLDALRHEFNIRDTYFLKRLKAIMVNQWKENGKVFYSPIGVPQGSILGPIFGNILLHGLDKTLESLRLDGRYTKNRKRFIRKGKWTKFRHNNYKGKISFSFVRFADDIRVIAYTKTEINEVYDVIKTYCDEKDITLSEEKTSITYSRVIHFTGLELKHNRVSVTRSVSNPDKIWKRTKSAIQKFKRSNNASEMMGVLLGQILFMKSNTNISWWINRVHSAWWRLYHRSRTKGYIELLWENGRRQYRFQGKSSARKNREITINLWDIWKKYKIELHKAKFGSFEDRFVKPPNSCWQDITDFIKRRPDSRYNLYVPGLLHQQKFKCKLSKRLLTPDNFAVHHKIPKNHGGTDEYANLCLLHKEVHRKVHEIENKNIEEYYNIMSGKVVLSV